MLHKELKMRCDLYSKGSDAHKLTSLYSVMLHSMQLYLMNDGEDIHFIRGVDALHKLNEILHTNYRFCKVLEGYITEFDKEWGCVEKVCLGTDCFRDSCIGRGIRAC
jgi:hypothetical protein